MKKIIFIYFIFNAFNSNAQCPLQPEGWSISICISKTEALGMNLLIGKGGNDETHRFWKTWIKGKDSADFPLPIDLLYAKEIWIKAATLKEDKNIYLCLKFNGHVVKHIDEDKRRGEEHEKNREDTDDGYECP